MTSEKRGLPLSPGGRAPTVPRPNGAGCAAEDVDLLVAVAEELDARARVRQLDGSAR